MSKIPIIIQREYISRVKRKSFIVTTLLAPIGLLTLIIGSVLISTYSSGRTDVAVVDESGLFRDITFADADDQTVYFHKIDSKYTEVLNLLEPGKEDRGKYQAILFVPANFNISRPNNPVIAYHYTERPGQMRQQFIDRKVNEAVRALRMKMLNIDEQIQQQMNEKVKLDYSSLNNESEKQGYIEAAAIVGLIMAMAIYISLFFYGTMIMKGVQEEKTNRIVEVLVSSVKPFELLMGKIIGVGAVGLTQFVLWIVLMFGINLLAGAFLGIALGPQAQSLNNMPAQDVDPDQIMQIVSGISSLPLSQIALLFPLYYLGGFLLYGSLFAAIGAAMGEDGDQQSLMFPVTVPIVISVFIALNVINNPDSQLGFWGSIVPFTSPVVMSALLPFRPDWWQIGLSVVLLIAGFILTTYIAARIYRVGILMYGKKVAFKEIAYWIFSD